MNTQKIMWFFFKKNSSFSIYLSEVISNIYQIMSNQLFA